MVGNIIHNMRSTLDQLVWQLVIANDETPRDGPRGNSFPIFPEPVDFAAKTTNSLRGVHPTDRARIERFQPYNRPNGLDPEVNPLVAIDFLWNQDKHRAIEVLAYGLRHTIRAALHGIEDVERIIDLAFIPGPIKNDAVIAWAEVQPSGPNPKVAMHGYLPTSVAFSNGELLIPNLQTMLTSTLMVIESFQDAFKKSGAALWQAQPRMAINPTGPVLGAS